jgi:hypothetical protein
LRAGGYGLFYYAGHGVQAKGRNYLIPIDATIQSETDVEDLGVDANLVLGLMDEARNGANVVILDACRNNPFASSFRSSTNGLAQVDAPTGTLIAYSTAPGRVASDGQGQNGLFTEELLKNIDVPGLSIEQLLKRVRAGLKVRTNGEQVPWESSSLIGNYYLNPPVQVEKTAIETRPQRSQPANNSQSTTVELAFWDSVKDSKLEADFKAYLERFPQGIFVQLAQNKLKQIESDSEAEKLAEQQRLKDEEEARLTKTFKGEFGFRAIITYLSKYKGTLTVSPSRIFFKCDGKDSDSCKNGDEELEFSCASFSKAVVDSNTIKEISFNGSTHRFNADLKPDAAAALKAIKTVCKEK